jgi:PIN domain nuclease of toxin-antitoxin system
VRRLLLDTHLLLWAALGDARLTPAARALIEDPAHDLLFSAASIWEVVVKAGLGRADFTLDARVLRAGLLAARYRELPVTAEHAIGLMRLPPLHRDPFDRILLAQADSEGATLLTLDRALAQYPGPVQLVA